MTSRGEKQLKQLIGSFSFGKYFKIDYKDPRNLKLNDIIATIFSNTLDFKILIEVMFLFILIV